MRVVFLNPVATVGGAERPEVIAPKIADADLLLADPDLKPISTSGIGRFVIEQNRFISRFWIIPRRAGTLTIPAITARLAARSGTSPPQRLNVQAVPQSGRTAAFLGGVGGFEVASEVSASRIRLGQTFEYRLRVTGPAALGMNRSPAVEKLNASATELKVELLPVEVVASPPSRDFRYRLRPLHAGQLVIPPVAIAAFDPKFNRFFTRVTPSVAVDVIEVAANRAAVPAV